MEPRIAYFSMEYGLSEELHTYAGGLGILAGDHLKGAADAGLPLVAIGILWQHGYTTQLISGQGWPVDTYPSFQYDFLEETGVTVHVEVRGRSVAVKAWQVAKYGNAPLYLLDTRLKENSKADQGITGHLYGGTEKDRIAQEIVLGIGGVRVLRALGLRPAVYHFNEGHAVLAATELIREERAAGASFRSALETVRQRIVFTTHTPVPEGNESHPWEILHHLGADNGLTRAELTAIGGSPFNMTVAGLRLARIANGVSAIHGQTARTMWAKVRKAAPLIHITNGVHPGTWQDPAVASARTPAELWAAHEGAKRALLGEIYARSGVWFDPKALLVGFARRAVPYKRPALIFHDPAVIEPLLKRGQLNIVFAGKAHPLDHTGKGMVADLVELSQAYRDHVVFLPNYDMRVGRMLTRGCDVWLNNPRPPLEASGTSGMKAAMNGVLNLSVPDGWWPEASQSGVNGWSFGGEVLSPAGGAPARAAAAVAARMDEADAGALYEVLLGDVVPTYYKNRDRWLTMMRASIDSARGEFSVDRMIRQYREEMYRL